MKTWIIILIIIIFIFVVVPIIYFSIIAKTVKFNLSKEFVIIDNCSNVRLEAPPQNKKYVCVSKNGIRNWELIDI